MFCVDTFDHAHRLLDMRCAINAHMFGVFVFVHWQWHLNLCDVIRAREGNGEHFNFQDDQSSYKPVPINMHTTRVWLIYAAKHPFTTRYHHNNEGNQSSQLLIIMIIMDVLPSLYSWSLWVFIFFLSCRSCFIYVCMHMNISGAYFFYSSFVACIVQCMLGSVSVCVCLCVSVV